MIDDEKGTVYFQNVRSATTKGSQAAGDVVVNPRTGIVTPVGYASNLLGPLDTGATITSGTEGYGFTLPAAMFPIRSQTLKITIEGIAESVAVAKDVETDSATGLGVLYGIGLSGTINHVTGAVILKVTDDVGLDAKKIYASGQANYELSTDLPIIEDFMDSKTVMSHMYALKGRIGLMQEFALMKRFGMVAEDELATRLTTEINREIAGDLIRSMNASAIGNTNWQEAPPTNISDYEHWLSFKKAVAQAEGVLTGNCGRGIISLLIAGKDACTTISVMPGFEKLADGKALGAHVYGTLNGVTVVRVLEAAILPLAEILCVWNGGTIFEAPAIWAPFMPLLITGTIPEAPNPLGSMRAGAAWGAAETLVAQYITKLTIT